MADRPRCNAPTMAGGRCQWLEADCRHNAHARWRAAQPVVFATSTVFEAPSLVPPAEAFEERDLRGLAWWVLEQVITGRLESPRASVAATLMRVISSLGEQDLDDDEYLRRQELGGLLLHGMPPETEEQWAIARQIYSPSAIEMVEGWAARRQG